MNKNRRKNLEFVVLICFRRFFPGLTEYHVYYDKVMNYIKNELRSNFITNTDHPQKPETLLYYMRDDVAKIMASEILKKTTLENGLLRLSSYTSLTFFDEIETKFKHAFIKQVSLNILDKLDQHKVLKCLGVDFISYNYTAVHCDSDKIHQTNEKDTHIISRRGDFIYDLEVYDPNHACELIEINFGPYRYPFIWEEHEKKWKQKLFRPPYSPYMMLASGKHIFAVTILKNIDISEIKLVLTGKYGLFTEKKRKLLGEKSFTTLCGEKYLKYKNGEVNYLPYQHKYCPICHKSKPDIIFLPCNCILIHNQCLSKMENKYCPKCHSKIQKVEPYKK